MILELDCGNSFIKWRIYQINQVHIAYTLTELFQSLANLDELKLTKVRISSVRSNLETVQIAAKIKMRFGIEVQVANSTSFCAGVTNGYQDPTKLGVDRWLDIIAAYHLTRKACIVFDLGTAITTDFVDSRGNHLGGFICPGIPLMRNSLQVHTSKIIYDYHDTEECLSQAHPGTFTAEAVERGCVAMIKSFVCEQISYAQQLLGTNEIFITGGDAYLVKNCVKNAKFIPDLIFIGLALACP